MLKTLVSKLELRQNDILGNWQRTGATYFRKTLALALLDTSVQCCTLFWGWSGIGNGVPLAEPHSYADHLTDHLSM
jgi:hypothetical protein